MSEAAEVATLPAQNRQAAQDAAAAAAVETVEVEDFTPDKPSPTLTKEDVAGKKAPEPEAKADRELVAPSIREFLRAGEKAPTQTALEREIADLRGALDSLAAPSTKEELSVEQKMLAKLEAMEAREAERVAAEAAAREEEAYNNRVKSFRDGVIENVNAKKEEYAGLCALEQQEVVFNALVQRTQEGIDTSEDEIASEVEAGLRTVYETLHKVYSGSDPSKDSTPSSERKLTLTPGLAGSDEAADTENMSRSERIDYLWAKYQQQ